MIQIRVIDDRRELWQLSDGWSNLLDASSRPSPYLAHEWLYAWWKAFGGGARTLHVLLVFEKTHNTEALIGILPAYIQTLSRLPRIRSLRMIGSGYVGSDYLDVIVMTGKEHLVQRALSEYFVRSQDFGLIQLLDIDTDSAILKPMHAAGDHTGASFEQSNTDVCPILHLPSTFEAYCESLTKSTRKNFRYRKRLEGEGVELELVTQREDFDDAFRDLVRLHDGPRSQQRDLGCFGSPILTDFHRSAFQRMLDSGRLDILFLRVGSERIATLCELKCGAAVHGYLTGYDINWEHYRPGFVMLLTAIEKAVRDGKDLFDFGRGQHDYKYRLGADSERRLMEVSVSRHSWAAGFYRRARNLGTKVKQVGREVAPSAVRFAKSARYRFSK